MATVSVSRALAAPAGSAERLWYDTARWVEWVDGLEEVTAVDPGWPAAGSRVTWRSGPAGRGTVTERVLEHGPGAGQRVAVRDDAIDGEQTVAFRATSDGVEVALSLAYRVRRRHPLTALVDLLFIRRAMSDALAHTLARFAAAAER